MEHDDRVVCVVCLKKLTHRAISTASVFARLFQVVQLMVGVFIVWFFFFMMGDALLRLPDSFHEGTIWQVNWLDQK